MAGEVDREITLFVGEFKVKGKVRLSGPDADLPPAAQDPFLDVSDVTFWEQGGKQVLLRKIRVRRTSFAVYYFEDDVTGRR